MPVVSIIVPIYNTEKYLEKCIESILSQSYGDYELILVNDGSPDNSEEICRRYAEKDSRIVLINQENGGLPAAKNSGLDVAKGEYIIFCDSDDSMTDGALSEIMPYVLEKNYDITLCTYIFDYADSNKIFEENIDFAGEEFDDMCRAVSLYCKTLVPWSACRNVIKREIIEKNYLRFGREWLGVEDCDFYFNVGRFAKSFGSINRTLIHYNCGREGSITGNYNIVSLECVCRAYEKWQNYFKDTYGRDADDILEFFSRTYYYLIINTVRKGCNADVLKMFEKYMHILRYVKGWKKRAVVMCYKIFGVKSSVKLFGGKIN